VKINLGQDLYKEKEYYNNYKRQKNIFIM